MKDRSLRGRVLAKLAQLREVEWKFFPLAFMHAMTDCFMPPGEIFANVRCVLLKTAGMRVSAVSRICRGITVTRYGNLSIGPYTSVSPQVYFDSFRRITVGRGCSIGFRACFITGTHPLQSDYISQRPLDGERSLPIVVEDFAWVGANAVILPGVTIGRGSVVAAGAVVTKNVEPDTVVAGVPARIIRRLDDSNLLVANMGISKIE